jgi:hypothetical protein
VLAASLVLSVLSAARASADGVSPEDLAAASRVALEAINPHRPVVVVLDDKGPQLIAVSAFGEPVTVMSRAQARDEQRAWFVSLGPVTEVPGGLRIVLSQPATGSGNTLVLNRSGQGWSITSNESWHSSSGARYFFGEMYEGVACRDDTEMAQRWRFTEEAVEPLAAHKPMLSRPSSGKCLGAEFPDVEAYRTMKRMRGG